MKNNYYTTSEAAEKLDVAPSTLRYWEKELNNYINIERNENGHRQYTHDDIEELKRIKKYLYEQNYTIKQVRNILNVEESKQELVATLVGENNENVSTLLSMLINKIDEIEKGLEEIKNGQNELKSDYLQSLKLIKMKAEQRDQKLIKEIRKRLSEKSSNKDKNLLDKLIPWKNS